MSAPNTTGPTVDIEPAKLAELIAGYASDVKAQEIVELDLRGVLGYTDYFIVASGGTDRQVKAVHDRIHENMKKEHGLLPRRVEGVSEARWILMDYLGRDRPHLHARGARVLPARAALGRSPQARRRVAPRRSSGSNRRPERERAALSGGPFA